MLPGVTTSASPGVHFPERWRLPGLRARGRWPARVSARWSLRVAAALLVLVPAGARAGGPAPASTALCAESQQVVFHCSLGAKAVSLCTDGSGDSIHALEYRYGTPARLELRWQATADNGRQFSASMVPLAPGANVRQLWFDNGGVRYLLSQCTGGACPAAAGLAVLRGQRLLSRRACQASADDRAWFSPRLGRFGEDAASSQSTTPLLQFDDVDNGVGRLYPPGARPAR